MGYKHSEETKAKLRIAMQGKSHTEQTKEILREKMTGKKLSPEAVEKMKASLKETWDKKLGRGKYAPKGAKKAQTK